MPSKSSVIESEITLEKLLASEEVWVSSSNKQVHPVSKINEYILPIKEPKDIMSYLGIATIASPFIWSSLRDYQKQRVLTFLDPDVDPLGTGWNIAQSQTAIGSGGIYGKGYLEGTSKITFLNS